MKLLYVLVSSSDDFYYEQALLSILSAKYRMPQISVSLLLDRDTEKTLTGSRNEILKLVNEIMVVDFDASMSSTVRSRSLKTTMRELVSGDFLYVDVDTLWVNPIDENDFNADIMGVPDGHVEFQNFIGFKHHSSLVKKLGFDVNEKFYINGGVLFLKDSLVAHDFMRKWNKYWQYSSQQGVFTDQQSLNYVNSLQHGVIRLMPHYYNVQISFSIRYLMNAKLIHYFGSNFQNSEKKLFFELQKQSFWKKLRESSNYLDMMKDVSRNPEKFFSSSMVSLDVESEFGMQPSYGLLCDVIKSKNKCAKMLLKLVDLMALFVARIFRIF